MRSEPGFCQKPWVENANHSLKQPRIFGRTAFREKAIIHKPSNWTPTGWQSIPRHGISLIEGYAIDFVARFLFVEKEFLWHQWKCAMLQSMLVFVFQRSRLVLSYHVFKVLSVWAFAAGRPLARSPHTLAIFTSHDTTSGEVARTQQALHRHIFHWYFAGGF